MYLKYESNSTKTGQISTIFRRIYEKFLGDCEEVVVQ